jgi:rhodanese-related sulfurtransferase
MQNKFITIRDTKENKNAELIDVRTKEEFEEEHIKNSKNISLDQIPNYIKKLKDLDKEIIIIGRTDNRARMAQSFLEQNQIESKVMIGGIMDWQENNYPLE